MNKEVLAAILESWAVKQLHRMQEEETERNQALWDVIEPPGNPAF